MAVNKLQRQERRKSRVRFKLKTINFANSSKKGELAKPRLSVFRSNKHIYAQIIDDVNGLTLVSASSLEQNLRSVSLKLSAKAQEVGKLVSQRALEKGVNEVVYDRGSYKYHGVISNLIEAAQENFFNKCVNS